MKTKCAWLKGLTLIGVAAMLITFTSTDSLAASIRITTDTATELSGSFAAYTSRYRTDSGSATTANFNLLPFSVDRLILRRSSTTSHFGSNYVGRPGNPFFSVRNNRGPGGGTITGSYSNSGVGGSQGPTVNYTISYRDSGTVRGYGALAGTFSFTTASVPDGGTTALLLGLGLIGFFVTHRMTRLAPQT